MHLGVRRVFGAEGEQILAGDGEPIVALFEQTAFVFFDGAEQTEIFADEVALAVKIFGNCAVGDLEVIAEHGRFARTRDNLVKLEDDVHIGVAIRQALRKLNLVVLNRCYHHRIDVRVRTDLLVGEDIIPGIELRHLSRLPVVLVLGDFVLAAAFIVVVILRVVGDNIAFEDIDRLFGHHDISIIVLVGNEVVQVDEAKRIALLVIHPHHFGRIAVPRIFEDFYVDLFELEHVALSDKRRRSAVRLGAAVGHDALLAVVFAIFLAVHKERFDAVRPSLDIHTRRAGPRVVFDCLFTPVDGKDGDCPCLRVVDDPAPIRRFARPSVDIGHLFGLDVPAVNRRHERTHFFWTVDPKFIGSLARVGIDCRGNQRIARNRHIRAVEVFELIRLHRHGLFSLAQAVDDLIEFFDVRRVAAGGEDCRRSDDNHRRGNQKQKLLFHDCPLAQKSSGVVVSILIKIYLLSSVSTAPSTFVTVYLINKSSPNTVIPTLASLALKSISLEPSSTRTTE